MRLERLKIVYAMDDGALEERIKENQPFDEIQFTTIDEYKHAAILITYAKEDDDETSQDPA